MNENSKIEKEYEIKMYHDHILVKDTSFITTSKIMIEALKYYSDKHGYKFSSKRI